MRRPSSLLLLLALGCLNFTSAGRVKDNLKVAMDKYQKLEMTLPQTPTVAKGLMESIQNLINNRQVSFRIPSIPFVSSMIRSRNNNNTIDKKPLPVLKTNGQKKVNNATVPAKSPAAAAAAPHPDWCGGEIQMDLNSRREFTFKSTKFPSGRSVPYACSWDVKVNKNCRRGRITMRMDGRSRLAHEPRCTKGYYRVTPFMKEAKICGRIGTVPSYQWNVDTLNPEDVTIIMKNIGLNDGDSEGLSFTLSGDCLNEPSASKSDAAMDNVELNSRWMSRLLMDSLPGGRLSDVVVHTASMSFMPSSKLSAKASEKISQDLGQATTESLTTTTSSSDGSSHPLEKKKPTKITFYSPLYLIFRKLNII